MRNAAMAEKSGRTGVRHVIDAITHRHIPQLGGINALQAPEVEAVLVGFGPAATNRARASAGRTDVAVMVSKEYTDSASLPSTTRSPSSGTAPMIAPLSAHDGRENGAGILHGRIIDPVYCRAVLGG